LNVSVVLKRLDRHCFETDIHRYSRKYIFNLIWYFRVGRQLSPEVFALFFFLGIEVLRDAAKKVAVRFTFCLGFLAIQRIARGLVRLMGRFRNFCIPLI